MERPIFQPPGTPVEELDTPALVVDLDVMERNISILHDHFRDSNAAVRPFVSPHQCPTIAHAQLDRLRRSVGVAVTTVGEAEVFAQAGCGPILVTRPVVTRAKIRSLTTLAGSHEIAVAVDNPNNVAALSDAALSGHVELGIIVEVDAGLGRCGVAPGNAAFELANLVEESPGLNFHGIMAIPPADLSDPVGQLQPILDTRELIERNSQDCYVSVAGTHNFDVASSLPGVSEVQAGSYPLMDYQYCQLRPEFKPAARVLTSVISHPTQQSAVLDAGHKATGPDRGVAVLDGVPGAAANRFSAEHGVVDLEESAIAQLRPGDKAWLVPNDLSMCVNQYDYIRAVRNGRLEGYWPISARGRFA